MVKGIKEIIDRLDGYSFVNQGFAVTSFTPVEVNGGSGTKLQVKPYLKDEEGEGIPEEEHLSEMINRLRSQYSDAPHYAVYKAEKMNVLWELVVKNTGED